MEPIYAARNISKAFGPVRALESVSVEIRPGEIHAVLGENGAGKSTLMGVLSGLARPDTGEATLAGSPVPLGNPDWVRSHGVRLVHQHFMVVPSLSVADNLRLDALRDGRWRGCVEQAKSVGAALGWEYDAKALVRDLGVAAKQRLEVLKALVADPKVLILDEPTAVLSVEEVLDLNRVLGSLRAQGVAIVLVAHKLSEVMAIADRVTVLRGGKNAASCLVAETDEGQLAEWMVGERVVRTSVSAAAQGEPVAIAEQLQVLGPQGETAVRGVSFQAHRGEILGIGGVEGNGTVQLAECLAGVRPALSGRLTLPRSIGYVPQDRHTQGLALAMSVEENLLLGAIDNPRLWRGPFVAAAAVGSWSKALADQFEIRCKDTKSLAHELSGGNQQKVVVARAVARRPELLVAVEPTRGLDIRASAYVHRCLREAAAGDCAVVLFSSDRDEIDALAHRKLTMSRGQFV